MMANGIAFAQKPAKETLKKFELKDGDRVIFLGGGLIEREQKFGYWEAALTAAYPERNITFRNLGWSGDTVWAESRGLFDAPEKGYARMIEQIKTLKPTVIFFGYGNNEAFAGEKGLKPFITQYEKLLDDLKPTGARYVIITPSAPGKTSKPLPSMHAYKDKLAKYVVEIWKMCDRKKIPKVDLFISMMTEEFLQNDPDYKFKSDNPISKSNFGFDLNHYGYIHTAELFREAVRGELVFEDEDPYLIISYPNKVTEKSGFGEVTFEKSDSPMKFSAAFSKVGAKVLTSVEIRGLPDGDYRLKCRGKFISPVGNSKKWESGYFLTGMHEFSSSRELNEAIIEKNQLFFHQWRPQNFTYLFGFRKHEQGQNAKEVIEFDALIAAKEKEIAKLRVPQKYTYELIRVGDEKPDQKKPTEK